MGAVIERLTIRPAQGAPELNLVVITLGLFILLNSVATWIWAQGDLPKVFPSPLSMTESVDSGIARGTAHRLLVPGGGLGIMLAPLGPDADVLKGKSRPLIACIGPITAETARENGLAVDVMAAEYTVEGLVKALVKHLKGQKVTS